VQRAAEAAGASIRRSPKLVSIQESDSDAAISIAQVKNKQGNSDRRQ
jgi:hypothetical protein